MKKKAKLQNEPPPPEEPGLHPVGLAEGKRKRKTKLQAESSEEPREHPTGPIKEKVQITIRIDKQLLDQIYIQMKDDNARLTDMVERGLILALGEARYALPQWSKQIRFVLANATKEQVKLIRGLAIVMVEGEIAPVSAERRKFYEICRWFLESSNDLKYGAKCLEVYSRYGKSAEEIAKLGS